MADCLGDVLVVVRFWELVVELWVLLVVDLMQCHWVAAVVVLEVLLNLQLVDWAGCASMPRSHLHWLAQKMLLWCCLRCSMPYLGSPQDVDPLLVCFLRMLPKWQDLLLW